MSAVSNSVIPRSIALWITLRELSRSVRWPKLLQPRPTAETRRPEPPRLRICMDWSCWDEMREEDLWGYCGPEPSKPQGTARHGIHADQTGSGTDCSWAAAARTGGAARSVAVVMRRTDRSASRAIALRSALMS